MVYGISSGKISSEMISDEMGIVAPVNNFEVVVHFFMIFAFFVDTFLGFAGRIILRTSRAYDSWKISFPESFSIACNTSLCSQVGSEKDRGFTVFKTPPSGSLHSYITSSEVSVREKLKEHVFPVVRQIVSQL